MNAMWRSILPGILVSVTLHLRGGIGAETSVPTSGADAITGSLKQNTGSDTSAARNREGSSGAARSVDRKNPSPLGDSQGGSTTNGLRMEFRHAPLNLVLDYLSDAAGFVINKEADVTGTVEMWCKDAVTKEEAVELLNAALKKNGYAVIRNGRVLTIVRLDTAKTADLEVVSGNDPETVAKSDEVVTQIIPVRYASASQLANNLQILLPTSASLSVNESANSLILVATRTDIRRMLKICHLLDNSLASVSAIRVFSLRYADSKQLATVIQQLFTPQGTPSGTGNRQNQFAGASFAGPFGGPGGGGPFGGPGSGGPPGGGFGVFGGSGGGTGAGGRSSSSGATGNAAALKVVATSDDYSNSLIVSAAADLMTAIAEMVQQIDRPVADVTELRGFRLTNADPSELADQLAQLFPDESRSGANRSQGQIQFAGGPPGAGGGPFGGNPFGGGGGGTQSSSSERARKMSQVLAVPDSRTSSLLVSAASGLMPQIAQMIERLDSSPARKEVVSVWELHNANVKDVNQVLQDLFNRNSTMRNNNSRNSLLGDNNPLSTRQTQQQIGQGTTGFGTSRGGGGIGSSGGGTGY